MAALIFASVSSGAANGDIPKPRPIPFPDGTYVASVSWPVPPSVKAESDRVVVEFQTNGGGSPLTCIVSGAQISESAPPWRSRGAEPICRISLEPSSRISPSRRRRQSSS